MPLAGPLPPPLYLCIRRCKYDLYVCSKGPTVTVHIEGVNIFHRHALQLIMGKHAHT